MKLRNYTRHAIRIHLRDSGMRLIQSDGNARVTSTLKEVFIEDGIRYWSKEDGPVAGLPELVEGTILIVSSIVQSYLPGRKDLVVPTFMRRDVPEHYCLGLSFQGD